MQSAPRLDTAVYFSEWLSDSGSRRYLLHFSQSQWAAVAKCTLLLGLGFVEYNGIQLNTVSKIEDIFQNLCHKNLLENVSCIHEKSLSKNRKSVAFEIFDDRFQSFSCHNKALHDIFNGENVPFKKTQVHRKNRVVRCKNGVPKKVPFYFQKNETVTKKYNCLKQSHHSMVESPSEWDFYRVFRRFLLQFLEKSWPSLIKILFLLGQQFLELLGIQLHLLSVTILRHLVSEFGCSEIRKIIGASHLKLRSYRSKCIPSNILTQHVSTQYNFSNKNKNLIPSSHKTLSQQGGVNSHLRNCILSNSHRSFTIKKLLAPPPLLTLQRNFPLQWVNPEWIPSEKRIPSCTKNDSCVFQRLRKKTGIYPNWWGQLGPNSEKDMNGEKKEVITDVCKQATQLLYSQVIAECGTVQVSNNDFLKKFKKNINNSENITTPRKETGCLDSMGQLNQLKDKESSKKIDHKVIHAQSKQLGCTTATKVKNFQIVSNSRIPRTRVQSSTKYIGSLSSFTETRNDIIVNKRNKNDLLTDAQLQSKQWNNDDLESTQTTVLQMTPPPIVNDSLNNYSKNLTEMNSFIPRSINKNIKKKSLQIIKPEINNPYQESDTLKLKKYVVQSKIEEDKQSSASWISTTEEDINNENKLLSARSNSVPYSEDHWKNSLRESYSQSQLDSKPLKKKVTETKKKLIRLTTPIEDIEKYYETKQYANCNKQLNTTKESFKKQKGILVSNLNKRLVHDTAYQEPEITPAFPLNLNASIYRKSLNMI